MAVACEGVCYREQPNGCIALELQARALCSRLVAKLHLTDEPKRGPGRPPNLSSGRY
jgi:hypothetical protein